MLQCMTSCAELNGPNRCGSRSASNGWPPRLQASSLWINLVVFCYNDWRAYFRNTRRAMEGWERVRELPSVKEKTVYLSPHKEQNTKTILPHSATEAPYWARLSGFSNNVNCDLKHLGWEEGESLSLPPFPAKKSPWNTMRWWNCASNCFINFILFMLFPSFIFNHLILTEWGGEQGTVKGHFKSKIFLKSE